MCVLFVSVPYEITLLSNPLNGFADSEPVSVPYEITLLSNVFRAFGYFDLFQYLMKLHYSQTAFVSANQVLSFSTL